MPLKLGSLETCAIGWREGEIEKWFDSRPTTDN